MTARFRFHHSSVVAAPVVPVHDLLVDLERYPQWWPQVRAVAKIDDDHAMVVCRSALPYDLELELTAVSRDLPTIEVGIDGPIAGWARWTLIPDGDSTRLSYEQEVEATGWLRRASYVVRPVLVWNHDVMMRGFDTGAATVFA